ncbi:MAG: hypothetical protein IKQ31_01155 [Clostridia bacterium]|nr:hypothetical protein [Clostridia bacterium]
MSEVVKSGRRTGYIVGGVFSLIGALLLFTLFFPEFVFQLTGDRPWNYKTAFAEIVGVDTLGAIKEWGALIILSTLFIIFLASTFFRQSTNSTFFRLSSIFGILSLLIPLIFKILSEVSETTDLLDLIGATQLIFFALSFISVVLGIVFWITQKYHVNRASTLLIFNGIFWTVTSFFIGLEGINSVFDGGFEFHKSMVIALTSNQGCMGYLSLYLAGAGVWMLCTIPHRFLRESTKSTVVSVSKDGDYVKSSPFGGERSKVRTLADIDEESKEKSRFDSRRTVYQPYTNNEQVATNKPLPAFRPIAEESSPRRPATYQPVNPFLQNVPIGRRPQDESGPGVTSGNANRPASAPPTSTDKPTTNSVNPYDSLFGTSTSTTTSNTTTTTNSTTTQTTPAYSTANNVTTQPTEKGSDTVDSKYSTTTTNKISENKETSTSTVKQENSNKGSYDDLFSNSSSTANTVNNTTTTNNTTVNNTTTTTNNTTTTQETNTNKGAFDALFGATAVASSSKSTEGEENNKQATQQSSVTQNSDLLSSPYAASSTSKNKPTALEFSRVPEQTPPAEINNKSDVKTVETTTVVDTTKNTTTDTTNNVVNTTTIKNSTTTPDSTTQSSTDATATTSTQNDDTTSNKNTGTVTTINTGAVILNNDSTSDKQAESTTTTTKNTTKKKSGTTDTDSTGTEGTSTGGVLPFGGDESTVNSILPQAYVEASKASAKPRKPRAKKAVATTFLMGMGQLAFRSTGDDLDSSGLIIE